MLIQGRGQHLCQKFGIVILAMSLNELKWSLTTSPALLKLQIVFKWF